MSKGVPLFTFNSMEGGIDRGLLHPTNFVNEWNNIKWHGATHIMDGWRKMLQSYESKFSDLPQDQWPLLLALVITDGELQDAPEFEEHLKHVKGRMFVEIAVVGYGDDHDKALQHYQKITKKHDHVRVTPFTNNLNPAVIVKQLLSLIDPNAVRQIDSAQAIAPSLNVIVNTISNFNSDSDLNTNENVVYLNTNENVVSLNANENVMSLNANENVMSLNANENVVSLNTSENVVYLNTEVANFELNTEENGAYLYSDMSNSAYFDPQ